MITSLPCVTRRTGRHVPREAAQEDYLLRSREAIPILPYDRAAAEWYASERARLAARGRIIPYVDGQIAAVAATQGLMLVTSNRSDFEPFEGLEIQDWKS